MNADDQRLIAEVARIWIAGGGDSQSFFWNWVQIKRTIAEMERENDEKERMDSEDEE